MILIANPVLGLRPMLTASTISLPCPGISGENEARCPSMQEAQHGWLSEAPTAHGHHHLCVTAYEVLVPGPCRIRACNGFEHNRPETSSDLIGREVKKRDSITKDRATRQAQLRRIRILKQFQLAGS
jgi:hypothetical protein